MAYFPAPGANKSVKSPVLRGHPNTGLNQYREPRTSENRVMLFLSSPLQDTVLAVSDLRQRVIARDQSDRSPIWPYQSRCICLLSIEKKFKPHQKQVLGEFGLTV